MKATRTLLHAGLALSLLVAAAGCKSKRNADGAPATPLINEGIVFREGFSEQTIPGRLQAARPATELHADCVGFIADEPTLELTFDGALPARIHVVSEADTVLVVEGPKGWECNDNFDGYNPSLARHWESGAYKIYVGSSALTDAPFEYDLNFDHYDPRRPLTGTPIAIDEVVEDTVDAPSDDADAPADAPEPTDGED